MKANQNLLVVEGNIMNAIPKLHENLGTGKISSYSVSTKFTQNFRYAGEAENFSDIVNVEKTSGESEIFFLDKNEIGHYYQSKKMMENINFLTHNNSKVILAQPVKKLALYLPHCIIKKDILA